MNLIVDKKTGLYCRANTSDIRVVKEVEYYKMYYVGKKVLDIGANIGAFSCWALKSGAKEVIAYEPEDENFNLLCKNIRGKNVVAIKKAIVGNDDKTRSFYLNEGSNRGSHSLYITRRAVVKTVQCENIWTVIEQYQPDVVKIDIEGGEYYLFDYTQPLPSFVKQIAIEFHLNKKEWRNSSAFSLLNYLKKNQFIEVKPARIGDKNWFTMGIFKR
jgi:FkbM family methyltransferase